MTCILRFTRLTSVSLVAATLVAACSERNPAAPDRVVQSIVVNGAHSLTEGETLTLTATVTFANETSEVVADGVTWSSDNTSVLTVSDRGVVTAAGPGEARIRATYRNVNGTAAVSVAGGVLEVRGRVHESSPTEGVGVSGATVTAIDSRGDTQTAVTDGVGNFSIRSRSGSASLTVTAAGYETSTTSVNISRGNDLSLAVVPVLRDVLISFSPSSPALPLTQRHYRVKIHHAGELRAEFNVSYASASAQKFTNIEVRDADQQVLAATKGYYDQAAPGIRLRVQPGEYEVKFYISDRIDILSLTSWGGEVRHPN